ncbi:DUF3325 domain-containing protein [Sphingomonas sp. LM7]|uniref:DUF3325 domain-containing protein n=1 Tax=Sphingomonas sp. LM7 TaxID=1938607 RepID=UPI000983CE5A|nr:DUF3325 domain-containing protein [Sphingomonas sp. LM7]AQR73648.1 hypothetical protein BXU08_08365 [Sphingomonas sp. LM7]
MSLITLLFAIGAFALFGFATDEHHQRRLNKRPDIATKKRLRIAAWVLIVAAFPPALAASGGVFGPILWAGMLMLGAGIVFLILNLSPAWRRTDRR